MTSPSTEFQIGSKRVGPGNPTYFIADVAANHDGDIERAKALIHLCAEAGADAAKFQHFAAETIVSDHGFRSLGGQQSHQAGWSKSVFQVYKDASVDPGWTPEAEATCREAGIEFFTTPYSHDLVEVVNPYVPAYKIGSGDVTWIELIEHIANKGKPCLIATGAATADDVTRAVAAILRHTPDVALMQCNTNYTGSIENLKYVQLKVLDTYRAMFPNMVLGLSDHTPGHATVLGAVALGARVVEKHFTDDMGREGPDHGFSMDPTTWRDMVERTRELEAALGDGVKKVEDNEKETVVLQRRSIRASRAIAEGEAFEAANLTVLRPCPADGLPPYEMERVVGCKARRAIAHGEHIAWTDLA